MIDKISGASYFDPLPKNRLLLEKSFVPLDKSLIWDLNEFFWQNTKLWEKTYGQHYEKSLPTGISSSHEPDFVKKSTEHFFSFLVNLKNQKLLPEKIIVLEQGPGTGLYAKQFLDNLKSLSNAKYPFYERLTFILSDTSAELLDGAKKLLIDHQEHLEIYQQKKPHDLPLKYHGQILFARHGNFWDQLPCRLIKIKGGSFFEIYVRAVVDKNLKDVLRHCESSLAGRGNLVNRLLRPFGPRNDKEKIAKIWKPLIASLKLETKVVPLKNAELEKFPYWQFMIPNLKTMSDSTEVIVSTEVLNNLASFLKLIDWQKGGYWEVVDIIVPTMDGFLKDRRPKKYDGALGVPINGPLLKEFLFNHQKHLSLTPIRGINSIGRIVSHNLQTLFKHEHFVTVAEIAPKREQNSAEIVAKAKNLFSFGADIVAFSDQAHAGLEYYSAAEIAKQQIFSKLPGGAILPILAARRKTLLEINNFCQDLKEQKVDNLFVLVGDPAPGETFPSLSWKDVLPLVSGQFITGAVAHPNPNDIDNSLKKIDLGARFLIVQACYDSALWQNWIAEVKAKKLHKKVKLIPVIIPIITAKSLEVLKLLPDVAVSDDFLKNFQYSNDQAIRQKGIDLARSMIAEYKKEGIFSGVYLYSRSSEVVREILAT